MPCLQGRHPTTIMSFNQSGDDATAKIGTYNDVAGNQTNDNSRVVGNIGNVLHLA
jgi:hypothetical protein